MSRIFPLLVALLQTTILLGQAPPPEMPSPFPIQKAERDSQKTQATHLREAFGQGHFHGHFRSFLMATDNARQLSDYSALAVGGGLHFSTAPWRGFSFGIGAVFTYNLASSDFQAKDSVTGAVNRYEIGLFDVRDPVNRSDFDRIQELWLRYQWKKSRMTVGRQSLQTPLVNQQDGRMRPTAEIGAWVEINKIKNTRIAGGWLWKISPRGTVDWFDVGKSIGIYPKGLSPDGIPSGYAENLTSAGVGILGISRHLGKHINVQTWEYFVEHIFNTALVQADYTRPLKNGHELLLGLQVIHQDALSNGGNADASKSYLPPGSRSNAFSTRAGWQKGGWQAVAAYTRITSDGRFLAPREWGREPFYTFMPRERVEGSGDSHSITGRVNWQADNKRLRLEAMYGHFYLPDVKNTALNKYAFPAFNQFNFDVRYRFGRPLEGLQAQFLYVWKGRLGDVYGTEKYVINKVDISLYNLILNYTY